MVVNRIMRKEIETIAEKIIEEYWGDWKEQLKEKFKEKSEDQIFNDIYQEGIPDLLDICYEKTEETYYFNFFDTQSAINALKIIQELQEYEETDSGLFEGINSIKKTIVIIAFYTFKNALISQVEKKLKEKIRKEVERSEI